MPTKPLPPLELHVGEKVVDGWLVDRVEAGRGSSAHGWLILTDSRLIFARLQGLLGKRLEMPYRWEVPVRHIRSLVERRFTMEIGYGERVTIPGVEIDGTAFRLNREQPAPPVLAAIGAVRGARDAPLR